MRTELPDCLKSTTGGNARKPALDVYDLAVRLELDGITDSVAWHDYGYRTTLLMAKAHFHPPLDDEWKEKPKEKRKFILEYLSGISFAIPVLLCALSTLVYKLSLWGGDLAYDTASAVAIGTVSSFIATGGIIQASARRSLFLIHTGDWGAAADTCRKWSMLGAAVVVIWAICGWAFNAYFGLLPFPLDWVAIAFHCALGLLWLACGVLYVLEQNIVVGAAVVCGIATVALCKLGFGMHLVASQLVGISVTASVCAAVAIAVMRSKSKRAAKTDGAFLNTRIIHLLIPFFTYGCLYYLFLFADRWMAWTARTNAASLPFQFRGDYETGLDIAMIAFVFQVGWVHTSMLDFYERIRTGQATYSVDEVRDFNDGIYFFYLRRLAAILIFGALSGWLTYYAAEHLHLLPTQAMREVTLVSLAGYPLLVAALWNTGMFFALSRPRSVLISAAVALCVNFAAGYLLSRVGGYQQAVYGFTAGSGVFACLTTWMFLQHARSIDHHHYASSA